MSRRPKLKAKDAPDLGRCRADSTPSGAAPRLALAGPRAGDPRIGAPGLKPLSLGGREAIPPAPGLTRLQNTPHPALRATR